ncbi:MAG: hypothetical protein LRZ85_10285 [Alphaproteobacteria bacterium]|nr:hypothetical protein [Alphaproteobacteria bacterium]MCD8520591.1 hypothetical protein [Alphaproteobacteria bacterium]MCD8526207.1 hypothetical protein [Alphaproteobacteria bacterium]MCD8571416.1 hypothetical protein [Alphaproteobacteria bacterium]
MRNSPILSLGNTREVAAMIVLSKFPPMKTAFVSGASSIITSLTQAQPLIVRKFWFGFDNILFDDDLVKRVRDMHVSEEAAAKLYEQLQTNPAAAIAKAREAFVMPEDIQEEISNSPVQDFIKIDLTEVRDVQQAIRRHVPFSRLQALLLRAASMTDQADKAVMTEIRIAHAPRLDNKEAAVDQLLAL